MDKMTQHLVQLSDRLDLQGKLNCANAIDDLIKHRSITKIAQYVGAIGYILKQNRAMGNCLRKKRAESNIPMQEIVFECLKEYQDGQQYKHTEWSTKYAQLLQGVPELYETVHLDLIKILATENQINDHFVKVSNVCKLLKENEIEDEIISSAVKQVEDLQKEGSIQLPFKLAAPPSQRNRWSRFWAPSWSRRGKDKDAQFEMDRILDGIVSISNSVQQIKSNVFNLRFVSNNIQNQNIRDNINALSQLNWQNIVYRTRTLGQLIENDLSQNPGDASISELSEYLSDIRQNISTINNSVTSVQRNMNNLRMRDAVKGRGPTPSAVNEYMDLTQALNRLYSNPLDERSIHFSQKMHGQLEDALNSRATATDTSFNDWVNSPQNENVEQFNQPNQQLVPSDPTDSSVQGVAKSVAENLSKLADPATLDKLTKMIMSLMSSDITPETRAKLNVLIDAISSNPPQQSSAQTGSAQGQQSGNPLDPGQFLAGDLGSLKFDNQGNLTASRRKMSKIANIIADLDPEIISLLQNYFENDEDKMPQFPDSCPILKE